STRTVVLLLEDHPLFERRVASAELLGPGDDRQSCVGQTPFPLTVLFEAFRGVHRLQRCARNVRLEEGAHLVAERDGGVVEFEIHYLDPSWTGRALAAIDLAFMPPRESVPTSAL